MNENRSDCEEYQSRLLELHRDPDQAAPKELTHHLAECAECRHEQAAISETIQLLGEVGSVEPPRHFFVYEEPATNRNWGSWWRALLSPQTAAVASYLTLLLMTAALVERV